MTRRAPPPLQFSSTLLVQRDGEPLAGPDRIALLEAIDTCGSITAAAQAVGISYRTAWRAVDAVNNLAGEELVDRSKGGAGGGGARLTASGRRLLQTYRVLRDRQQAFLRQVAASGEAHEDAMTMLARLALHTSARNQLAGTVDRCDASGPQVAVQLRLANAQTIRSLVSRRSQEALRLAPGVPAIAVFKASAVRAVLPDEPVPASANRLEGSVADVEREAGRVEFTIALPAGLTVCALQADEGDAIRVGRPVVAVFDPASVLLAAAP